MKLTRIQLAQVKSIMTAQGIEVDVRIDYSGRGMYGATCVGFVLQNRVPYIFALANAIADVTIVDGNQTEYDQIVAATEQDDMGLDTIIYFPGVELASEEN